MRMLIVAGASIDGCKALESFVRRCLDRRISVDAVIVCGSLQRCYDLYEYLYLCSRTSVFGVDSVDSDVYETRFLKAVEGYVSGRWVVLKVGAEKVCIGGVDELNRGQNIARLLSSIPVCSTYIVVCSTPIRDTKCFSASSMLSCRLGMDVVGIFTKAIRGRLLILGCRGRSICIDSSLEEARVLSIPQNSAALVEVRSDGSIRIETID